MLFRSRYCDQHPEQATLLVPRAALWTPTHTYLEPDLFLLAQERLSTVDLGRLATADLVVEILSPGSAIYDRNTKADTYAAMAVRELWLVDPELRIIEVRVGGDGGWSERRRFADDDTARSTVFSGLTVAMRDVFPVAG